VAVGEEDNEFAKYVLTTFSTYRMPVKENPCGRGEMLDHSPRVSSDRESHVLMLVRLVLVLLVVHNPLQYCIL